MSKVVVGFSVIPPRFFNLENTIESLLNQTRQPDKIYLYIADYYPRFNVHVKDADVPPYLKKYDTILRLVRGRDYGPISKLFCSLKNETDPDTIIVTCDDDLVYKEHWLDELVTNCERQPNSAVGLRGRLLSRKSLNYKHSKCITCSGVKSNTEVDIVTAVRGWAYRKKFFNDRFIDEWCKTEKKYPFIFFNDDIWISGQLEKKGIKKLIVPSKKAKSENMRLHGSSLIKSPGQHNKTDKHIQLFKDYWKPKLESFEARKK